MLDIPKIRILLTTLFLATALLTSFSQRLGEKVVEYDFAYTLNDSTVVYNQILEHPVYGFQDTYYLEIYGICEQVDATYQGYLVPTMVSELYDLGFVYLKDSTYINHNNIAKIKYHNNKTTVSFYRLFR